jgi:hypothetical protein
MQYQEKQSTHTLTRPSLLSKWHTSLRCTHKCNNLMYTRKKSRAFSRQICTKLIMLSITICRSHAPNFTQIGKEIWKAGKHSFHKMKYECNWANFHETHISSHKLFLQDSYTQFNKCPIWCQPLKRDHAHTDWRGLHIGVLHSLCKGLLKIRNAKD